VRGQEGRCLHEGNPDGWELSNGGVKSACSLSVSEQTAKGGGRGSLGKKDFIPSVFVRSGLRSGVTSSVGRFCRVK